MTPNHIHTEVYLTLEDDFHDFDTLEVILDPLTEDLEDHFDNPNEEFRYEILNELHNQQMWKAGLHNPEGPPYKIRIGTATINTETEEIHLDLEKTSHHSIEHHELTTRDT